MKLPVTAFTPAAADQLLRYGWPGNVRELQNVVERAVVLARGARIEVEDLPDEVRHSATGVGAPGVAPARAALDEIEREHILERARVGGRQPHEGGVDSRHRNGDAVQKAQGIPRVRFAGLKARRHLGVESVTRTEHLPRVLTLDGFLPQ